MTVRVCVALALVSALVSITADAKRQPLPLLPTPRPDHGLSWKLRKPWTSKPLWHPRANDLVGRVAWPPEPASPAPIDVDALGSAVKEICEPFPEAAARRLADALIASGRAFDMDPFLMAGLAYRESRCRRMSTEPDHHGVTRLPFSMYRRNFRNSVYRYHVPDGSGWRSTEMRLDRYRFTPAGLGQVDAGLYFTAAFLAMWRSLEPALDLALGSVPHRSFISHWVWGDFVAGTGAEDRILTARRRLIAYYLKTPSLPVGRIQDIDLHPPLDGMPRVVTSPKGTPRDGQTGPRVHRGIDLDALTDEPVRAVADGFVAQAAVDLPGNERRQTLTPEEAARFPRSRMGAGGLFLCLGHGKQIHSCYMHLNSFAVKEGDTVEAGQLIGRVGRTGVAASGAHLHFELRVNGDPVDPIPYFGSALLMPSE